MPLAPGAFLVNHGQWDSETRAIARFDDLAVRIERQAISFFGLGGTSESPRGAALRFTFLDADPNATDRGEREESTRYHFLVGNDPNRWASDVPAFRRIVVEDLFPGIDLVAGDDHGTFTYDFVLAPGAADRRIEVRVDGADSLHVDDQGTLTVTTSIGELRQSPPRAFTLGESGERASSPSRCDATGSTTFAFDVSANQDHALVVDPGINWSTALGGLIPSGTSPWVWLNLAKDSAVLADDEIVLVGATGRIDFPTTPGVYGEDYFGNWADAFVTRIASDGASLVASTFLGGVQSVDSAESVCVQESGSVIVAGYSASTDYPQTPGAYDSGTVIPGNHPLITRLNASLAALEISVLIGATKSGRVNDVALASNGDIIVVGDTVGAFPTTPGAFDTQFPPENPNSNDAFLLRLRSDGSALTFSTRLGGDIGADLGRDVAVAPGGSIVCVGSTTSPDFPITAGVIDPSFTTTLPGTTPIEGFVTAFDPTGSSLVFSTFFGGNRDDIVKRVAVGADGVIVISGDTHSTELPTTPGAFQPACKVGNGCVDAFVSKLTPDGTGLIASTFFGGADHEWLLRMHLDSSGAVTIAGDTWSDGGSFPTTKGAYEEIYFTTLMQAYVARLTPNLRSLSYSTTFGTDEFDSGAPKGMALAVSSDGSATVASSAGSAAFPVTPGAFDTSFHPFKCYVIQFDMLPKGVTRFGAANEGCAGSPSIEVIDSPSIDHAGFAITSSHATPGSIGFLGSSFQAALSPIQAGPVSILLDPTSLALVPVTADAFGYVAVPILIRAGSALANHTFFTQFFWTDSCAYGGYAASAALRIEAQQ